MSEEYYPEYDNDGIDCEEFCEEHYQTNCEICYG